MNKYNKPWKNDGNDIIDKDEMVVCSFGKYAERFTGDEIDSMNINSQLITAAPDLLAASKQALSLLKSIPRPSNEPSPIIEILEYAIDKAEKEVDNV